MGGVTGSIPVVPTIGQVDGFSGVGARLIESRREVLAMSQSDDGSTSQIDGARYCIALDNHSRYG